MADVRNHLPEPNLVITLRETLQEITGLPFYSRHPQGKNAEDVWFIRPAALDFVVYDLIKLHGQKKSLMPQRSDYRAGITVSPRGRKSCISFTLIHNPHLARNFSENVDPKDFSRLDKLRLEAIFSGRSGWYWYSSRERESEIDIRAAVGHYQEIFTSMQDDLFYGHASQRGNYFTCALPTLPNSTLIEKIQPVAEALVPLLGKLFPSTSRPGRRAGSLRNSLKREGIECRCEYNLIQGLPKGKVTCSDRIEGAHIIPHLMGGTFDVDNGLWLCSHHHQLTEGKLSGSRAKGVRFTP